MDAIVIIIIPANAPTAIFDTSPIPKKKRNNGNNAIGGMLLRKSRIVSALIPTLLK